MTLLALVARELRVAARHGFTYYLRVLGAGAVIMVCALFGFNNEFKTNLGGELFAYLHGTLFCAIWVLVPLLTADCISRERREGTLGLLFLTKLKASDIVVAKGVAHGLRAVTLLVAVLPVVAIPFLLGGLGRAELVMSLVVNLSSICWALAAGLLASAWSKVWTRALVLAELLAAAALVANAILAGFGLSGSSPATRIVGEMGLERAFASGLIFFTDADGAWSSMAGQMLTGWTSYGRMAYSGGGFVIRPTLLSMFGLGASGLVLLALKIGLCSLIALAVTILLAGAKTDRVWQEEPPSARQRWIEKTFCTPIIWLNFFRRWMRRKLEVNPIGWLEQRTWTGRIITWGWFGVIVSLLSAALTERNFFSGDDQIEILLACLLIGSMAMSAAGSFRRERESGVLELLLVSPVGEREIIFGRLRGLWGQFLPAFGLLLSIWFYFISIFPSRSNHVPNGILFCANTFLFLPVIGLYFSLGSRNFIMAFLSTLLIGLLVPFFLSAVFSMTSGYQPGSLRAALFQFIVASICWLRLHDRLKRRSFPLERVNQRL
jgi:ABC-type transport system involved in multi-copper enzyme maturation permease subunit